MVTSGLTEIRFAVVVRKKKRKVEGKNWTGRVWEWK